MASHTHVTAVECEEIHKTSVKYEGVLRRDKALVTEINGN